MEHDRRFIEQGGSGRSMYWALFSALHRTLDLSGHPDGDRRIDWEAAKASVLSVLRKRRGTEEDFLTNEDIRGITHLNRFQVLRLMHELMDENLQVKSVGKGRWTRYLYQNNDH